MTTPPLTHEEALDLAPLYVLDALEASEGDAVRRHLATCSEPHPEFAELGGVVPHLAAAVEPVDAPPQLWARIREAVASDAVAAQAAPATAPAASSSAVVTPRASTIPSAPPRRFSLFPALRRLALPLAATFVIVALGAWNVALRQEATRATDRAGLYERAVAALTTPGAAVARLEPVRGAGPVGFAAFPPDGTGYILLRSADAPPVGKAYQAWFLGAGEVRSAGVMRTDPDCLAVLADVGRLPQAEQVAIRIEDAAGASAPTMEPIVAGELQTAVVPGGTVAIVERVR